MWLILLIIIVVLIILDKIYNNNHIISNIYGHIRDSFDTDLNDDNKTNITCKRPTKDNPFMNPLVSEYNIANPPIYCNSQEDKIKKEINDKFETNLYRNYSDIYNTKNSQRAWYTVPMLTMPPDNADFAQSLNNLVTTCKEDTSQCLRYVDLRAGRLSMYEE